MKKILTVIGARPQIIKAAAVSRAVRGRFADRIEEKILHTGQHYDANMSQVFFDELGIPVPDYNLNVGSGAHGVQTARMIEGIESVLKGERRDEGRGTGDERQDVEGRGFDGIILYGDTNSTLAGAVAAAKLHVPIFHIEAGLRSFNMAMPEEVNRIVCDQLASICFCPTETGMENLRREGFMDSRARFRDGSGKRVVNSGDVMYDNSLYFAKLAEERCDIMERLGLKKEEFILSTIHRDNNTDDPRRLTDIFRALLDIAEEERVKVVLPLHPRTRKLMPVNMDREVYRRVTESGWFSIIPPASFFEIIMLEKNARLVMTDSGGVQKEAFFFERPCVILRPETEWVEIVEHGAGVIADADYERIRVGYRELVGRKVEFPRLFGDGDASGRICGWIC